MSFAGSRRPYDERALRGIDTSVPNSARIWNYWLGGKDNYAVDREAGDRYREIFPGIVDEARAGRGFLARAVRCLAAEHGIRQFLDVGTGLPTLDNTHEVAQRVAPEAHIVYVDNDPMVLAHARAVLTGTPEGRTAYVEADLRDPANIVRAATQTLDLARPTALMLIGVLGHVTEYDEARSIVAGLMDSLPSGSFLVLYEATDRNEASVEAHDDYNESGAAPYRVRSPEQIEGFFTGLKLLDPGVVPVLRWRPDTATAKIDPVVNESTLVGVGRKP